MDGSKWQRARLIPVSGIGGQDEQERRASSAILAVITAVREFNRALLKPLGAPAGAVDTYTEVPFELADGRKARVDGLISVKRGNKHWVVVVEVKTGSNDHSIEQVETYLDLVKEQKFDGLLTISNQIAPVAAQHPVRVNRVKYRKASLFHLSWTKILSLALTVKDHTGVSDPDQAWILAELIRYLEYEGSGAMAFDDMGSEWVGLRGAIRQGTLRPGDTGVQDVAARWDQLVQYLALVLGARLGSEVRPFGSRKEAEDPAGRLTDLAKELVAASTLTGTLSIPHTVGPMTIRADLKAMTATVFVDIGAPDLKRSSARLNWLLRQLKSAPDNVRIDVSYARSQSTASELLFKVRDKPSLVLGDNSKPPRSFRVALTTGVGSKRKAGQGGFITDVASLVDQFYGEVVQDLRTWSPPAPQLRPGQADGIDAAEADDGTNGLGEQRNDE